MEEQSKEEHRVRFAHDLESQIERREEIKKDVEEREERQELAEKFDQWKLEEIDARDADITVRAKDSGSYRSGINGSIFLFRTFEEERSNGIEKRSAHPCT